MNILLKDIAVLLLTIGVFYSLSSQGYAVSYLLDDTIWEQVEMQADPFQKEPCSASSETEQDFTEDNENFIQGCNIDIHTESTSGFFIFSKLHLPSGITSVPFSPPKFAIA